MNKDITSIGYTNFRNRRVQFGVKVDDRRRHVYVIGKTGGGKSNLLEMMAIEDIKAGRGVGVIDPHGEFAEKMLDFIPEDRIDDVIYFNPADIDRPIAFNPLERVRGEHKHLVASGIMSVFKKIWIDAWSARMEYILNNALLALLEYPDSTLLEILKLFSDKEYRKKIVDGLEDPVIKGFWVNEFGNYTQRLETESLASIQNKVGQFASNPMVRNIIGQPKSTINMREIMDEKKIFIANLSKGRIGEDNSALLGSMLMTRLQLAAMSRVDIPEEAREDFFLSVDEFQNFATEAFASILSEARKYHLSLILAHQYVDQLSDEVRSAVFGNVGTLVVFRVGAGDADFLEKEFVPEFTANDLVNLPKYQIYIRLMVDGVASRPFSAETIPPLDKPDNNMRDAVIQNSRNKYGSSREAVEEEVSKGWGGGEKKKEEKEKGETEKKLYNKKPYEKKIEDRKEIVVEKKEVKEEKEESLKDVLKRSTEDMPEKYLRPKYKSSRKHLPAGGDKKVDISDLRKAIEGALTKKEEKNLSTNETSSNEVGQDKKDEKI